VHVIFEPMPLSTDLLVVVIFAVVVLIQVSYYLFFFSRLAFHKPQDAPLPPPQIPVSIIVCAFNEEANLTKNLPLLLNQQYHKNNKPYFEVVVVNDNSSDDTLYLLNRMQEDYPHLHVVHLTQEAKLIAGKKFPLSMGIKSARCEHLLLTDADCMPATFHWLAHMAASFSEHKKIILGYSPYRKHPGWLNKCIRFETTHTAIQYLSYALSGCTYMGVGRNLAYVRSLFNTNKGFSSHHHLISGDDDLFINQVATSSNTRICIHPDAFTYSEPKKSTTEWHYQKKRHLSTGKHYKPLHKALLGLYALSHSAVWLGIIPCLMFPQYIMYTAIFFSGRWLLQWLIFQRCFGLLKQSDLINYIWVFDVWLFYYHIKSLPLIFRKNQLHWK
jgi:glycosyltransferase involved in cell wall biosynthesis